MTRAAGGRGKHGSWRHEHTGSRYERWCVHCACLVDVVHFFVWCRENARALNEWHERVIECRVCGRSPCFLDDYGDKYPPSWVLTWYACNVLLVCGPCTCRLKLLSTLHVMLWELADEHIIAHLYRFHGISSSLRLLTVFLLLMWVCGTCVCQVSEVLPSQRNKG